ncbi:hypothetical protein ACGF0J_33765 [Nonomuraea sp. NPDC047897]|uniref:hypothetical protein n=1 Tax=Nonomuraea sp. NPDC047897 TaxID=3364346 RepID=UPI003722A468
MSTSTFTTAIAQARDLLRWRSPLRTELWAARLAAGLEQGGAEEFVRELTASDTAEARLVLAALFGVEAAPFAPVGSGARPDGDAGAETDGGRPNGGGHAGGERADAAADVAARAEAGRDAVRALPGWVARMGQVMCEGAWYGKADRYGQQTLAALRFRYHDDKEPHVLVVGVDQVNGGLAVDALVDEPKFLDDLRLDPAEPGVVAGRILDALELTDRVMGAMVADTFPSVRPFALGRARAVPHAVRSAPDDTVSRFQDLPDLPGATEAFGKLVEFVGDRPLWWSPARVSQLFTSWLPREAILSEEAIAAMPEVVRAWSRFSGGHREVLDRVDADAPLLAGLMADESLAGLGKRIALNRLRAEDDRP